MLIDETVNRMDILWRRVRGWNGMARDEEKEETRRDMHDIPPPPTYIHTLRVLRNITREINTRN